MKSLQLSNRLINALCLAAFHQSNKTSESNLILTASNSQQKIYAQNKATFEQKLLLEKMSVSSLAILNLLIGLTKKSGRNVYIKQEDLGLVAGVRREQANKIVAQLKRLGFIRFMGRYRRCSIYRVAEFFQLLEMRTFKHLLPALIFFSFNFSIHALRESKMARPHTIINNNEVIYKKDYLPRERDTICEVFYLPKNQQGLKIYDLSEDYTPADYKKELEDQKREYERRMVNIENFHNRMKKEKEELAHAMKGNYFQNMFEQICRKGGLIK